MLGGGAGLATGLVVALFPFAAIGGGLLAVATGGGAVLGALAGHAALPAESSMAGIGRLLRITPGVPPE